MPAPAPSTPADPITIKVGAHVRARTARGFYRGVVVAVTTDHAVVKCTDGRRRSIPWTCRSSSPGRKREPAIEPLSDDEVWMLQRPRTTVLEFQYSNSAVLVASALQVDTDEFRADVKAITEWVRKKPASAVTPCARA